MIDAKYVDMSKINVGYDGYKFIDLDEIDIGFSMAEFFSFPSVQQKRTKWQWVERKCRQYANKFKDEK